mmetsp:Transcript_20684/g.58018  ORF Transcript_20684/g.58018 Transcript_20684/m.58018 type:complete len:562 (-) Transcript_20684:103-1788(-)
MAADVGLHPCPDTGAAARPGAGEGRDGLQVTVCGRLVDVPGDCLASLPLLTRELLARCRMGFPSTLQVVDVARRPIRTDEELCAAVREGRHPLQALPTMVALREIEQQKVQAETSKEEMTHIQWQIVADQVSSVARELSSMAVDLQNVRSNCSKDLLQFREQEVARRDHLLQALAREAAEREACRLDLDMKVDRVVQMLNADRSARDVASHQLGMRIDEAVDSVAAERAARAQECAETGRALAAIRHDVDLELQRCADHRKSGFDMQQRLEERFDTHTSAERAHSQRLTELEMEAQRLRTAMAEREAQLTEKLRVMRGELVDSIQNEASTRQKHLSRMMKEFDAKLQTLEAQLQRARSDFSDNQAVLGERLRAVEEVCVGLERGVERISEAQASQAAREKSDKKKATLVSTMVNGLKDKQKCMDGAVQAVTGKVDDFQERVRGLEKARLETWKPMERAVQQHELRLDELAKKLDTRLLQAQPSGPGRAAEDAPHPQRARFIEVPDELVGQEGRPPTPRTPRMRPWVSPSEAKLAPPQEALWQRLAAVSVSLSPELSQGSPP